jgi:hypothetical protein
MTVVRPNKSQNGVGARWVLHKHGDFRREFVLNGAVDFAATPTFTDQDGDDWGIVTSGVPTAFGLQSTGVVFQMIGGIATGRFFINPKTLIPGLRKRDELWILFRLVSPTITGAAPSVSCGIRRNISPGFEQNGLWRQTVSAGARVNPLVTGENSSTEFSNAETHADTLFSINVAGLTYEYRKQTAATAFPSTPDPEDITLFTASGFNGRFSSKLQASPVDADIDLTNELIEIGVQPGGGSISFITLTDVWIYRLE